MVCLEKRYGGLRLSVIIHLPLYFYFVSVIVDSRSLRCTTCLQNNLACDSIIVLQSVRSEVGTRLYISEKPGLHHDMASNRLANRDQGTHVVPSLHKTAYHVCVEVQRDMYDEWKLPRVDLRVCCKRLFGLLSGILWSPSCGRSTACLKYSNTPPPMGTTTV